MFRSAALFLPSPSQLTGRMARAALACSALALLSACGGGDRAEEYQPDRVVVFGDEHSAFAPDEAVVGGVIEGLTYTVSSVFGGGYGYCQPSGDTTPCDPFLSDGAFENFVATAGAPPNGTGYLLQTSPNVVNTVYLLTPGVVTYTPTGGTAATPAVRRERQVLYDCTANDTAFQRIAHTFNKGFSDNCTWDVAGGAKTFAAAGAKVADLQAQVNQASGQGLLGKGTLVTVWIGQNDIIEIVKDTGLGTLESKRLEAKTRAERLAQVILQINRTGAKVIVIGATDLSYSPWAMALPACAGAAAPCPDVQAVVSDFNQTLKLGDTATGYKGLQDLAFRGRDYAFVDAALSMRDFARNGSFNLSRGVCALPSDTARFSTIRPNGELAGASGAMLEVEYCTTQSLFVDTGADAYVWADDRRLAPVAHQAIANAALIRAVNQF